MTHDAACRAQREALHELALTVANPTNKTGLPVSRQALARVGPLALESSVRRERRHYA